MRAWPALAAILFAASAWAGPMMPPGPSPESGFAGVWRFIDARPAPWAKPRKLTKADAPLLEYAVDFEEREVKGPAALACKAAQYSSGVTYHDELFGGRFAIDKSGAMANALHLSQPDTYRVICGKTLRDYYIDDNADMVLADGDVIYTLERPTGMDPEQYKPGFSGPSFDCTAAKTTSEKLICSDAELAQSDRKLGGAWSALKNSVSAESFASFVTAQRAWIAYAMKSCGGDVPMPESVGDKNPITECLNTKYGDRAQLLEGLKTFKAGALTLEPRMRFRTRPQPDTEESDIAPRMSGGPQADAFNGFVFKTLKLDRWRMDDKNVFRYGDDVGDMKLYARRFYSVTRFDSRVVSLWIATADFVGGRDEERGGAALNWDMAKGRGFSLSDVFAKGNDWKKFAAGLCAADLRKQLKADEKDADISISDVAEQVANGADWLWGKDAATVTFTVFMDGGMPE